MDNIKFVYLVSVVEGRSTHTQPVRAAFADAVEAIDWVREQYPQLETHIVHDAELDQGVVWVGQTNLMHAQVWRLPVR